MIASLQKMFGSYDYHGDFKTNDEQINTAKNHPKGKRHRTFGKEITSFGEKPNYGHLKRRAFFQDKLEARRKKHEAKVWELNQEGIIWTLGKLYWKDRTLAELNKN